MARMRALGLCLATLLSSANAVGTDLGRTDPFTIRGRLAGTGPDNNPSGPIIPLLQITAAEFHKSRGEHRIRGQVAPISTEGAPNMVIVEIDGNEIARAFPDVTGAWTARETLTGQALPAPTALSQVAATSVDNQSATRDLVLRN